MRIFARLLWPSLVLMMLPAPVAASGFSEHVRGIQTLVANGHLEQAIDAARAILQNMQLPRDERKAILELIAKAETQRAQYGHYQKIGPALRAIEALLQEFPEDPNAAEYRWQRAFLLWRGGSIDPAVTALREILSKDQKPAQQRRAWLLLARIHLRQNRLNLARRDLLQYGLNVVTGSSDQALGSAWMAVIDWREGRKEAVFDKLASVYRAHPSVITSEPEIYAVYIQALHARGEIRPALEHADRFLERFIRSRLAPQIRLLRADIMAKDPARKAEAIKEYNILAHQQAETTIGRQAFMRGLMLENKDVREKEKLMPVMAALKRIADQNQLSIIEDEATLDLARLWRRLFDISSAPDIESSKPMLLAYAHAAASINASIRQAAQREGSELFQRMLQACLEKRQWLSAVRLWRAFPRLRPQEGEASKLRFGIAHAMRMIMMFDAAEAMLNELYQADAESVQGERIMTELIKLWYDRGDEDAVEKSMRWLNTHQFTIYRPEILTIIARMQLRRRHAQAARQTLANVKATDLALESRAIYWRTRAEIAEALSQWPNAAKAWRRYRESPGAETLKGLRRQADALWMAKRYAEAAELYRALPDDQRDTTRQYRLAICELHTGEINAATEKLQALAAANTPDAYSILAKASLAERLAGKLLQEER